MARGKYLCKTLFRKHSILNWQSISKRKTFAQQSLGTCEFYIKCVKKMDLFMGKIGLRIKLTVLGLIIFKSGV